MRNLVNFNASSGKSENLYFDVLLLSIEYKVLAKHLQKNCLTFKNDPSFEKKNFCLKNDMKNLVNSKVSSAKSKNLHHDVLLL